MNDDASTRFKEREAEICSAMADTMKALYACYVDDFNCDTEGLTVKTYIIVDSSVNYDNGVVRASMLKQELSGYVGKWLLELVLGLSSQPYHNMKLYEHKTITTN